MSTPSASTVVKAVAAAALLTGASFAERGAHSQSADHPNCARILDAARNAQCHHEQAILDANARAAKKRQEAAEDRRAIAKSDAAIADHQKAAAEYRTEAQCLSRLSEAITGNRVTRDEVRGAFKTPTETTDACEVVRRLQPRLGELNQK